MTDCWYRAYAHFGPCFVTGREHGTEAQHNVAEFARRNPDQPGLPEVLAALAANASLTNDEQMNTALRGLLPAYFADYWDREAELAPLRTSVHGTYISGIDEVGPLHHR